MINFFRKTRQKFLRENRFTKYLLYATGEIILVVIGILIALQVNNWNIDRQVKNKEQAYLLEIRNNLQQDSLKLQEVLDFNENKDKIVEDMLQIFVDTLTNKERFRILNKNANDFTYYEVFDPVRIAFNNMLSAESIGLIGNSELRKALSEYYNYPYLDGVQNRISVINRRVVDEHYPKFFTKEFVQNWMGFSSKMPPLSDLDIATDNRLMSDLFGIKMIINVQNELIKNTQKRNQEVVALLNSNLKN
ncbi:MAG: hypothetical protein CMC05_01555 [Flavobacteriaceae bacterium]|uniref:DUF6090 family protein n=1 Tax=Winogradskyella poriferorum TaxID=307627 RepID=UPI000C4A4961|nr:hypothetical protein [Flavobacteriaceae bacterium]MBD10117.1 hypothetical protein [Flavobacteriaceae bacterium]|tara:strand:+ start:13361 stop:14104 length:744 start_codon:yes stop_codon:yes gene_type:complete